MALLSTVDTPAGKDDVWESVYRQEVPRTREEMSAMRSRDVVSPPDPHLLKVAIVGVPNSGKSTLINKLMGWRVKFYLSVSPTPFPHGGVTY